MWGDSYSFCKKEPNVNIKAVSMFGVDNLDTQRSKSLDRKQLGFEETEQTPHI